MCTKKSQLSLRKKKNGTCMSELGNAQEERVKTWSERIQELGKWVLHIPTDALDFQWRC